MPKYKVLEPVLVEKGQRHIKGEFLKVEIDAERAANLIRVGYIEEVGAEPKAKKIDAAPEDKMIHGSPESKATGGESASGKGAKLLKGKKK